MRKRAFTNPDGAQIKLVPAKAPFVGAILTKLPVDGMLTKPRPHDYTDDMLSRDMRAARQAMMSQDGDSIRQAREDIKDHIRHIDNQRARI